VKTYESDHGFVLILEPGEKIKESIKKFAETKSICGFFIGIGAVTNPEIAYFDIKNKEYVKRKLAGMFEIVNLTGNIRLNTDNKFEVHAHISLGNKDYNVIGGHLIEAEVAVVLEIFISKTAPFVR